MKLINNSDCALSHGKYVLAVGEVLDVPENVAKVWQKYAGVRPYVSPEDLEEEKRKAVEEALKAERAKVAKKATAKKTAKK